MSEPLFYLMTVSGLWLLARYLWGNVSRDLLLCSFLFSLAFLARYSAGVLVLVGAITIGLMSRQQLKSRVQDVAKLLTVGLALPGIWLARNFVRTGNLTNRTAGTHPIDIDTVRRFLDVISFWFTDTYPSHWRELVLIMIWILVLVGIALVGRRSNSPTRRHAACMISVLVIFLVAYAAHVLASLAFLDASIRIDDRILSPILLSGALASLAALGSLPSMRMQHALAGCVVLVGLLGPIPRALRQSADMLTVLRLDGVGFTSREWRSSSLIGWIRASDSGSTIVTNEAMAVQFSTGHPAIQLPEQLDPVTERTRPDYLEQVQDVLGILGSSESYLVTFGPTPSDDPYSRGLGLVLSSSDGAIYSAAAP